MKEGALASIINVATVTHSKEHNDKLCSEVGAKI
jgi:hypothetical protein